MAVNRGLSCAPVSFLALTVVFQIRPIRDTLCLIEDLKPARRVARVKLTLTTRTVDADRRGGAIINPRQEEHDLLGEAENGGSIAFRS